MRAGVCGGRGHLWNFNCNRKIRKEFAAEQGARPSETCVRSRMAATASDDSPPINFGASGCTVLRHAQTKRSHERRQSYHHATATRHHHAFADSPPEFYASRLLALVLNPRRSSAAARLASAESLEYDSK